MRWRASDAGQPAGAGQDFFPTVKSAVAPSDACCPDPQPATARALVPVALDRNDEGVCAAAGRRSDLGRWSGKAQELHHR